MITCFMFKDFIWDIIIQDMILNGDMMDRALGIACLPFMTIFSLTGLLLDLIGIPLYLLVGLVYLILKIIERIKKQNGK